LLAFFRLSTPRLHVHPSKRIVLLDCCLAWFSSEAPAQRHCIVKADQCQGVMSS
jgi:hypothetical protein